MKKTKLLTGKAKIQVVGYECDICQNSSYVEYIRIDKVKFLPEHNCNKRSLFDSTLSTCALCGKDFCDKCWQAESLYDTACEDGVLCPVCGKTHYIDTEHEGVAVCRRSDNKEVHARWL